MSYFIVPSVSYQTNQKLQKQKQKLKQKDKQKQSKRKKKLSQSSGSSSSSSSGGGGATTTTKSGQLELTIDEEMNEQEEYTEEDDDDYEEEEDNKSILTTNSISSRYKSNKRIGHKSNNNSNQRRKLPSQQQQQQQQQQDISPTTKVIKTNSSPSVLEEPLQQQQKLPYKEDINQEATMIASKYGEALRSGSNLTSNKSGTTTGGSSSNSNSSSNPNITSLAIPPPPPPTTTKSLRRHRSNSTLSTSSTPLSSSPLQSQSQSQSPLQSQSQYNQNQAFHRNTSITSSLSQNSQNSLTKDNSSLNSKFRKLSFFNTSNNSIITSKRKESISSLPGGIESPGSTSGTRSGTRSRSTSVSGSKVDGSYFPDYSDKTSLSSPNTNPNTNPNPKTNPKSNSKPTLLENPSSVLPPFKVITDLSVYNTPEGIESNFFAPNYQVFRYNSFLDLLSEYHQGDAINVSTIRYHLLLKFIIKQKNARDFIRNANANGNNINTTNSYHLTMTESVFAYQLYGPLRYLLRYLIKQKFQEEKNNISRGDDNDDNDDDNNNNNDDNDDEQFYNHEELIQMNFINFIRYIMQLPEIKDSKIILNETEKKIYEFKEIFQNTAKALYILKKDKLPTTPTTTTTTINETKDDKEQQDSQGQMKLLVETITKICYEYILLEKYRLDIISKFHNNHLIDKDILKELFDKYNNNMKLKNPETVKVFLYNISNLIQFGWYFAITIPFVRVIESNIYNEDLNLIKNYEKYYQFEKKIINKLNQKINFQFSDKELFDNHIKKLLFKSFNDYNLLSMEKLIKLIRIIDNQSNKFLKINRNEIPNPSKNFSTKPMNFEYFNQSIIKINSNNFDMIHSSDLIIQINLNNYKTLISEFYRILKPGGILNLDCINFGGENFHEFNLKYFSKNQFPEILNNEDYGISKHFNSITNFLEIILKELNKVFKNNGNDNDGGSVKFGISLLSSKLDLHSFATKFVSMRLLEVLGKFDLYCDYFLDAGDNIKALDDESIHFGVQIRATKGGGGGGGGEGQGGKNSLENS